VARRSGLGKGLGALIPTEVMGERGSSLVEIPIGAVRPNAYQPRKHFDEEALASLTASVRELGILQPILVRPAGEGYELIAGERRWRAAKRAGLQQIPAIVRDSADAGTLEQALVENLHRQDLNALEEAAGYQQLIEEFRLTHDELATRVGKSRTAVTNTLRLFQLPPSIQKLVADNQLSGGHARALLGTPDRAFQESLARRAVAEGLSVRAVEEAVRLRNELGERLGGVPSTEEAASPKRGLPRAGLDDLAELLSHHLDTRVKVEMGNKRGRIVVEFGGLEDLERIYKVMTEAERPVG
jgi:ParB family transcriptional regulator, chromosome partitioning protein